jgi:hypothetical protein
MGVACTLEPTQGRASYLWMLRKPLQREIKTAPLALGEIPSVPEKDPSDPAGQNDGG